jgi:hypothetical protein
MLSVLDNQGTGRSFPFPPLCGIPISTSRRTGLMSEYNTLYNGSSCSHVHDLNSTLPTLGCCRHESFDQAIVSHSLPVSNGSS